MNKRPVGGHGSETSQRIDMIRKVRIGKDKPVACLKVDTLLEAPNKAMNI
jgi:hypothetical protein